MTESRIDRDSRRTAGLDDSSINASAWTVLFKCAAGSSFGHHEYLTAGAAYKVRR
jgi:hypothetical protein